MAGASPDLRRVSALAARAVGLAERVHPHREWLLAGGLGVFLLAALPLVGVAQGWLTLAPWHVAAFAASVPIVLWAYGLATLATFFHPVHGLVPRSTSDRAARGPSSRASRLQRMLGGYAAFTVVGFAAAPFVVLLVAAVGGIGG